MLHAFQSKNRVTCIRVSYCQQWSQIKMQLQPKIVHDTSVKVEDPFPQHLDAFSDRSGKFCVGLWRGLVCGPALHALAGVNMLQGLHKEERRCRCRKAFRVQALNTIRQ